MNYKSEKVTLFELPWTYKEIVSSFIACLLVYQVIAGTHISLFNFPLRYCKVIAAALT